MRILGKMTLLLFLMYENLVVYKMIKYKLFVAPKKKFPPILYFVRVLLRRFFTIDLSAVFFRIFLKKFSAHFALGFQLWIKIDEKKTIQSLSLPGLEFWTRQWCRAVEWNQFLIIFCKYKQHHMRQWLVKMETANMCSS